MGRIYVCGGEGNPLVEGWGGPVKYFAYMQHLRCKIQHVVFNIALAYYTLWYRI